MSKESKSYKNSSKKFYIRTFGCQMNKNDSSIIASIMENGHYKRTQDPCHADIYIVNTCSVREHAEQRALGHIASLKKWSDKEERVVAVVGCIAQRLAGEITRQYAFVNLVLGPDSYRKIATFLDQIFYARTRIIETKLGNEVYGDIFPNRIGITDFVSIMRGCDNFCTYCIVPYVRGRARSRPGAEIMSEIQYLVHSGVKDITLLGQNVNEYSHGDTDFAGLLNRVAQNPELVRLRFLTSHPKDLDEATIKAVRNNNKICEWFHLPLQSGCDRILRLMNRKYTKNDFQELVQRIRRNIPDATVTTDIIVGFPQETEEEFQETIGMMTEIDFDNAYLYRYSPRQGTKAFEYESLPEPVIKDRLKRIIDVQNKIVISKNRKMIGQTYEVLFESPALNNATRGKTRGNTDVIVEKEIAPGVLSKVIVKEVRGRTPIAEIIKYFRY